MKKFWWIIIFIVALLMAVAVLQEMGIITIKWQSISIMLAALIAPFKYLFSLLKSDKERIDDIVEEHESIRKAEHQFQEQLESDIRKREDKVEGLNHKIDRLNEKVDVLEKENSSIKEEVLKLSVEEKKSRIKNLFGN